MKTKIIKSLIKILNNDDQIFFKIIFLKKVNFLNFIIKKNSIYIFYGKKKIIKLLLFYSLLFLKNKKFDKNPFLFFKNKNKLIGHNLIPDWTGKYLKNNFIMNLFNWIKIFVYIIMYKRNLFLITIKVFK